MGVRGRRPDGHATGREGSPGSAGGLTRRSLLAGAAVSGMTGATGAAIGRWTAPGEPKEITLRTGERTTTTALRQAVQPDGVFRVETTDRVVGLSFDDGPDPRFTPSVLDILARHSVRATFFAVGVNALAHRDLLQEELAGGHTIGNHTYDHAPLELLDPEQVAGEIDRGERALVTAGAPVPTLFRPPRGFTDEVIAVFADAERYRTVFWTFAVEHFVLHAPVDTAVSRMLARVRAGDIVLAHDGGHVETPGAPSLDRSSTVAALPKLLDGLDALGFAVVDIATLLRHERRRQFEITQP